MIGLLRRWGRIGRVGSDFGSFITVQSRHYLFPRRLNIGLSSLETWDNAYRLPG
jgi:hypothetical protein